MIKKISKINPYAVAVLSVFAATVLTQLIYPFISSVSFSFFYAAIAITAWTGGIGPGLVAILLSILSSDYFFLAPDHSLMIAQPEEVMQLVLVALVSLLINYLISALKNARHQIEQLGNQRLQESEQQLRRALQAAHMGMWDWNLLTGEIVWTPEHEQLLGLAPGSFDGRYETFDARLHPDDRERLNQAVQNAIQEHRIYKHEFRVIWTDGSIHWVEGRGQAFYDPAGQPLRMTGTLMDVDDRKRLETALRKSEQQFRAIFEAEPECVKVVTADGILHNMNPAGLAMLEADSLGQVQGQCVCPLIEPDHQQAFLEFTQQAAQGKNAILEFEIKGLRGTRRWLESHAVPLETPHEEGSLVLSVTRDITERKQAEECIQRSEERYRSLVTATFQIVWTSDTDGNITSVSPSWFEVTGKVWDGLSQGLWVDYLHPDDRDRAIAAWKQSVATQTTYEAEYRLRAKDGNYRDFKVRGVPIKNSDGSLREWVGTLTDITEHKQAEMALRESEEKLRLLIKYAPASIAMFDREMRYISASQRWVDDYQLDPLIDIIGRSHYEIFPEISDHWKQIHQRCLAGAIEKCDDDLFVRANGMQQWISWEIRPWYTATEEIGGIIIFAVDVTARKQAEAEIRQLNAELEQRVAERTLELQQTNNLLNNFFNAASSAAIGLCIYDQNLRVIQINEALATIDGYSIDAHLGKTITELLPDLAFIVSPLLQQVLTTGTPILDLEIASELPSQPGVMRYWLASYFPILSSNNLAQAVGVGVIVTEISDRKRAEAILMEADRRWRSLLDNVQLIVVGLDHNGHVEYINPYFLQLTGFTKEEVLGKYWFSHFLPPSQQPMVEFCFQEVLEKEFYPHYQNSIMTKQGEECMIAWSNTLLRNAEGKPIGTISIGEDITKRHKLEQMKAEFISIVSHELRTPLTSISGALELLSTGLVQPDSDRGQETLEIAATEADRLTRLVNDILDLERLESGKVRLDRQPWDLAQLMTRAVDFMQLAANQTDITLAVEPLSVILDIDGDRILQVLTNLLSNAVKFSPKNSTIWLTAQIERETSLKELEPKSLEDSSTHPFTPYVLITVRDQGRGIPANKLESIFERFQQVDASDSRKRGGTGLGLAICRSIVQQHDGNIWAESSLDQGSSFYFTLPLTAEN